jgi:pyruvate/2-oxoglutarate dehydrogenase complex dihydrolipoamide dehydrogenase (E3) component
MACGGRPFQASASAHQARIHVKERFDRTPGATVVARHAGEMINEITFAMAAGIGLRTL